MDHNYRKRFERREFSSRLPEAEQRIAFVQAVISATDSLIAKLTMQMTATERVNFESFRVEVTQDPALGNYVVRAFIATTRKTASMDEILTDPTFMKAQYDGTSNMEGLIPGGGEDNEPGT